MTNTFPDILSLYEKYGDDLRNVTQLLQPKYHEMMRKGFGATFGDVEGEVLYLLTRELQPENVFEISPNAGWSSNYILAALTHNNKGTLHSFDIMKTMNGVETEAAIRGNQCKEWDQSRHKIYIGDARERCEEVPGTIEFLLIDSAHEDWFAEWYVAKIIPRVQGAMVIQDIANVDLRESSTEATYILDWLRRENLDFQLIGEIERNVRATNLRNGFAERRSIRSNSIILSGPSSKRSEPFELEFGPEETIKKLQLTFDSSDPKHTKVTLDTAVQKVLADHTRANRHRQFMKAAPLYEKLGCPEEAKRCRQRSLGIIIESDAQQRIRKYLPEMFILYIRQKQVVFTVRLLAMIITEPRSWMYVLKACGRFVSDVLHRR